MIFRSRPEKRIKVIDDLRDAAQTDFRLRCGLTPINYIIPPFPKWCDKVYHRGEILFNPYKLVCSCPHFEFALITYPENDARRLCNHMLKYVNERFEGKEFQPGRLIAESAQYPGELFLARYEKESDDYWFTYRLNSPWVEVYVHERHWIRYSFNIVSLRWSHGLPPKIAEQIQQIIITNFSQQTGIQQ